MPTMITDIEDFFTKGCGRCDRFDTPQCSAMMWNNGLVALRRIATGLGLVETVKWGHPCYMHAGRNIVLIGALQGDYRLNFFNAGLMKDPEGIMEKQGPNTQNADSIKFTDNNITRLASTITSYLAEAMEYAEAGIKAEKKPHELDLPEEFVEAMDADGEMAEAFHVLTPGRQRSYEIILKAAKKSETRIARIQKFREKILSGKGANER